MIKSMTGYAHGDFSTGGIQASLEIKSWNNRYLDISVSTPSWLSKLEPRVRDFLSSRIAHGKVEFGLRARSLELPVKANADLSAARSVAAVLRDIARAAGIEEPIRLHSLLSIDGILSFEREIDENEVWAKVLPGLERLFLDYDRSRLEEGAALLQDLFSNLGRIETGLAVIRELVPEIERTLRKTVEERFAEILGEAANEGRMLAEVASLLMKYTINEEVVRLGAHCASFRKIIGSEAAPGKKLDFLCQEMNREVNTIGSKSMLLRASETVVELKDALENIREQLRNIE
jgi:uncharacterized protein (TIGR00255 family)